MRLTADSTGRTLPGHERAAEVDIHPDDPTIHQALAEARHMATFRYSVS